jgi:hypothetical protein
MHGCGAGWFDETGAPMPTDGNNIEGTRATLLGFVDEGLVADSAILNLPLELARIEQGLCIRGGRDARPRRLRREREQSVATRRRLRGHHEAECEHRSVRLRRRDHGLGARPPRRFLNGPPRAVA